MIPFNKKAALAFSAAILMAGCSIAEQNGWGDIPSHHNGGSGQNGTGGDSVSHNNGGGGTTSYEDDSVSCNLPRITDDTGFVDSYPVDMKWQGDSATVKDIENAFNRARAKDSTISQKLILPSQEEWDTMSMQERGLYILNNERYYRGLKPFEGISERVADVAKKYAELLYAKGAFGHTEDGTPWDRLNRDSDIASKHDFFKYGENLYVRARSSGYTKNPVAYAIYNFIYNDNASTNGSYGHRKFCLAKGLKDNSGEDGAEGLIGFGTEKGRDYAKFPNMYSTLVVMNGFDPSSEWDHSTTIKVPFCTAKGSDNDAGGDAHNGTDNTNTDTDTNSGQGTRAGRFVVSTNAETVLDTKTSLMWQNIHQGFGTRDKAIARCNDLTLAGYNDWRLPDNEESGVFQREATKADVALRHINSHCTAEVTSDGYIRTALGAKKYGKNPGDPINFGGGAHIRCVREN